MSKSKRYKIAILILSLLVLIQGLVIMALLRPKKVIKAPVAVIRGRIAICLDDWGYNPNNLSLLDQIRYPLTASILPNLNYSRAVAEALHRRGFEIILHLPLEPHEEFRMEKNTILISMDEARIKDILSQDLAAIPYVRGVSNHMGSLATEDTRTMETIFKELKKRGLYFLDSFVARKSVCSFLARQMHLNFARRDVFLDNIQDREYIKTQIYKLKNRAGLYGQAIGIGHDRRITLEVLAEVMPQLAKEGYKFVFVSELTK